MRKRIRSVILTGLLATGVTITAQHPNDSWQMLPGPPRSVQHLEWRDDKVTQVWMTIVPANKETGLPIPVSLIFSAEIAGAREWPLRHVVAPRDVRLMAIASPMAIILDTSLMFVGDDGRTVDLVRDGTAQLTSAPCDGCAPSTRVGMLSVHRFMTLVRNRELKATILGIPAVLTGADLRALSAFASAIGLTS